MTHDTIVIGAGLAGLTAALRLADEGQRVLVSPEESARRTSPPRRSTCSASRTRPSTARCRPCRGSQTAHPGHPYARLSVDLIAASIEWFKAACRFGYRGGLDENVLLPTAVGVAKPSAVVPETMVER